MKKGMLLTTVFYIGLTLLAIIPNTFAKEEKEEGKKEVVKLDAVVVTATRTEEKVEDIPIRVQVITEEEIKESGSMTVGDIIGKQVTGHYHRYQGMLQPVGMRGFQTETHGDDIKGEVLILMDGHRIGTGNMAKLLPDMIERIEIIKGPASALYGAAAMGGVINVITKKGIDEIKSTLKQEGGSFGYNKTSVSSGGGVNDWFGYQIAASYEATNDIDTKDYGKIFNSNERHKYIGGNLLFYPGGDQEIRVGFDYTDLMGHYASWADTGKYTTYDPNDASYADKSRGHADIEYNTLFMEGKLSWKALGYYLWDSNKWYSGDPTVEAVEDDATMYEDETFGIDQQFTLELSPNNKMVVGGTYESLSKESEGLSNGQPKRNITPAMEYKTTSFYGQDALDFFNGRLNLVLGARYDKFELTTIRPKDDLYLSFNELTRDFDHISPRAGIVYKFNDFLRARGNIGQAFKSPSAFQLTAEYEYTSGSRERRYLGNPDLEPETSITYETGFDFDSELVKFSATYFLTDYKDKIVTASESIEYDEKEWSTWENLGKAEMQGIELSTTWNIGNTFKMPFSLIFSSNIAFNIKYKDEIENKDLTNISDYEVKSNLDFKYQKAAVSLSHVWIGPEQNTSSGELVEKKAFNFFDMTLGYELSESLSFNAGAYNLTNKGYEWVGGYPMAKRNFKAGLTWSF